MWGESLLDISLMNRTNAAIVLIIYMTLIADQRILYLNWEPTNKTEF